MKQRVEDFYNMLKDSGELDIFFTDMTGDWKKDKEKFSKDYQSVMDTLNNDR